jgi:hypothetical protein
MLFPSYVSYYIGHTLSRCTPHSTNYRCKPHGTQRALVLEPPSCYAATMTNPYDPSNASTDSQPPAVSPRKCVRVGWPLRVSFSLPFRVALVPELGWYRSRHCRTEAHQAVSDGAQRHGVGKGWDWSRRRGVDSHWSCERQVIERRLVPMRVALALDSFGGPGCS